MDGEMLKMKRTPWISSVGSQQVSKRAAAGWIEGQLVFSVSFPEFLCCLHLSSVERNGHLWMNNLYSAICYTIK